MKRTTRTGGKTGTGTHFPPTRAINDGGHRRKTGACPYLSCGDERGVALLMALAILVLLAILAVSFYESQSLEREGADNARYARSAESIAESGLSWATDLLGRDKEDAAGGLTLAYDTDYDIWGPLAKDHSPAYNNRDDLLFSGSNDEVNLSSLYPVSNPSGDDARWIGIYDGDRLIGRFAVIVEDESGKVNLNVSGNMDSSGACYQCDGISPAELALNVMLDEIGKKIGTQLPDPNVSAQEIIALRYGEDKEPGVAGTDDDGDGQSGLVGFRCLDDNLNNQIDETGDAVDEPDEHDLWKLVGDDIVLNDLSTILLANSIQAYRGDGSIPAKVENYNKLLAYLTVNSRTQNLYQVKPDDDSSPWRTQLLLDGSESAKTIYDRLDELDKAGRLPKTGPSGDNLDLEQIAANIADFLDEDSNPNSEFTDKYGIEKTGYLNEIQTDPDTYTANGVVINDHGEFIELINPYDVPVKVIVHAWQQGPNGEYGRVDLPATVPARAGDQIGREGYYVIGDKSGWYDYTDPDTGVTTRYFIADLGNRPGGCNEYQNLYLGEGHDITLTTEGGQTIEIAKAGDLTHMPGAATAQKDDPRLPIWVTSAGGNLGGKNALYKPGDSGDKDGSGRLSNVFAVYDGKLGSVGHLGKVYINQPWATINLTGDENFDGTVDITWDDAYKQATWLNIYDIFTPAKSVGQDRYGLINVNTAPKEVLAGLKDLKADQLYQATHGANPRVIESIGELGEFLPMGTGNTTWEREKHLSDIAGLVTVRSSVFRVTVRAQALGRQGEVDKRGERWLQASVERTMTVDNATGKATPHVRVLSMRWLVNE